MALSASAIAGQYDSEHFTPSGTYFGVKGGYNNINISSYGGNIKKDHYFANAHLGYLTKVADNFTVGPQIGATYYGNVRAGSDRIHLYSFNLYAVGQYTVMNYYLAARLGGVYGFASGDNTKSSFDFGAGASIGYFFTQNFSAGITYDHIFGSSNNPSSKFRFPSTDSVGISVDYHF